MSQSEAVEKIQTELDALIDDTEDILGRSLNDAEYDSLLGELLADFDDESDELDD